MSIVEVTNLSSRTTKEDLAILFKRYGSIDKIKFTKNRALIYFGGRHDARKSLVMNKRELDCKPLNVHIYTHVDEYHKIFKENITRWNESIKSSLPIRSPDKITHDNIFPNNINYSGERLVQTFSLVYNNLSSEERQILVSDELISKFSLKNILNTLNNFGYYNVNVLRTGINEVSTNFKSTTVKIKITAELIKTKDYYGTIGEYRLIWENICIKKIYSAEGLETLAKELHVKYTDDDDLCLLIGERVNNLRWSDFST